MDTTLVVIAALVIGGIVVYLGYLQAKKRREAFAAFAASHGWTYVAADNRLAGRWTGEPFGNGDNRRAVNVVSGQFQNRTIIAFDYSYQTHHQSEGRRRTTTHKYGVVAMEMPGSLPHLQVEHEGVFGGAVANMIGFADIQFESERFNRAFRVKAGDERFGHAVVHPRMMEMLLAVGGIGWRFEGNTLVGWDAGNQDPHEILRRLDLLHQILALVPPYVWKDYAGVDPR